MPGLSRWSADDAEAVVGHFLLWAAASVLVGLWKQF